MTEFGQTLYAKKKVQKIEKISGFDLYPRGIGSDALGGKMDIKEYRYVYEIAKQGGISKAAKELYISQPSLSEYLKGLEARLGFRLFEQIGKKTVPTSEGKVYLDYARQILGIDASLMETLEKIRHNQSGIVRLGIPVTRSAYILPNIMQACMEAYPGIEVEIVEGISWELEEMAYHREVDFILINLPFKKYSLKYREMIEEQVVLVIPEHFEVCKKGVPYEHCKYPWMNMKYMEDVPITLLKPGQRLREIADNLYFGVGVKPKTFLETQSAETALALARKGMSACLIYDSYFLARPDNSTRIFSVGESPICHQFVIAYPQEAQLSAPAQAIMETILLSTENLEFD